MRIGVLTSGGDAPGMNAAIRAIVRSSKKLNYEVIGIRNGYLGLVEDDMSVLLSEDVAGMLSSGGTFLGTSRLDSFHDESVQQKAVEVLKNRAIDVLICIGGDGTFAGALALKNKGVNVICVPATIDNDVGGSDYAIGFQTALDTIVDAIDKIRDTSTSHQRCSIIEVMGRYCGDLAMFAAISTGAEYVLTKEFSVDKKALLDQLTIWKKKGRRHAIIVVTEKQMDVHAFAHEITTKTGFSSSATVLGYVQRGGNPVPPDRILATSLGCFAIDQVRDKNFGVAVGVRGDKFETTPIQDVFNEKKDRSSFFELFKRVI